LIQNPKAQQELHKELDRVVVDHREITLDDSPSLPYTNAVIMVGFFVWIKISQRHLSKTLKESQRMANIISQNLIRRTTRNLNINGYSIKKGTAILAQISAVMADPEVCLF
jgi:cytochrome P450